MNKFEYFAVRHYPQIWVYWAILGKKKCLDLLKNSINTINTINKGTVNKFKVHSVPSPRFKNLEQIF